MEMATNGGKRLRFIMIFDLFSGCFRLTCRKNTKNFKKFKNNKHFCSLTATNLRVSAIFITFAVDFDD